MIDFVGKRYWFFLLSALLILPGIVSLLIPPALKIGIDFTGGSELTLRFQRPIDQADLRAAFSDLGHPEAIIQRTGEGFFFVRTKELEPEERDAAGRLLKPSEKDRLVSAFQERLGEVTLLDFDSNSPIVAAETAQNAFLAVVAASVFILAYIAWAFRTLPKPFRYGTCAVVALIHDVLVVLGVFSLLGKLLDVEVNAMFITALLTVAGFSVHDTIVVFDRIRENLRRTLERGLQEPFEDIVNVSLIQTLGRSLSTSITVILTTAALLLFGGPTIREFLLAMLIGITSGTYSSIFNASQLLVVWESGELGRLFRRVRLALALLLEGLAPARG